MTLRTQAHDASGTPQQSVWSDTGLRTARNDLLENGYLYIAYDDDPLGDLKIAQLDRYLHKQGLFYHKRRTSGLVKYELVEFKRRG